jgi:hypothetical protein
VCEGDDMQRGGLGVLGPGRGQGHAEREIGHGGSAGRGKAH